MLNRVLFFFTVTVSFFFLGGVGCRGSTQFCYFDKYIGAEVLKSQTVGGGPKKWVSKLRNSSA